MSKKELFSDKKFIPLAQASEASGYAKDYIGQLCREEKITCRRIGRAWFVDLSCLYLYINRRGLSQTAGKVKATLLNDSVIVTNDSVTIPKEIREKLVKEEIDCKEVPVACLEEACHVKEKDYQSGLFLRKRNSIILRKKLPRKSVFKKAFVAIGYGFAIVLIASVFGAYFRYFGMAEEQMPSFVRGEIISKIETVYVTAFTSGGVRSFGETTRRFVAGIFDYASFLRGGRNDSVGINELTPEVSDSTDPFTVLFVGLERSLDSSWIISGLLALVLFVLVANNIRMRSKMRNVTNQTII